MTNEQWQKLREQLQSKLNLTIRPQRIRSIRVNSAIRWQPPMEVEVGKPCAYLEPGSGPQVVEAIFDGGPFLVCTACHGIDSGSPYFFARGDVRQVINED